MNQKLWSYLRRGKRHVEGWLQRIDAEIIGSLLDAQLQQDVKGSCVEIGVHHGKSFIPLCLALRPEELALCVDIFEDQHRNLDQSGSGNLAAFHANLGKFGVEPFRIRIFKGSSDSIRPAAILQQVGPARFFSIDGGHWRAIVQNDLLLAEQTLAAGGVVALDDYCRAEWPDVTHGYALWQERTESDIVPFAVGSNKLYLCRKGYAPLYRAALRTAFLKHYFSKTYQGEDGEIDCYRVEPFQQDEEGFRGVLASVLKVFRPDLFVALKKSSD